VIVNGQEKKESTMKKVSDSAEISEVPSIWVRGLLMIERQGNRLPAPALLFLYLIIAIIFISAICQQLMIEGTHPSTQEGDV
jgi:p-aminobenzoyl-glutamate transporter AbgT